MDKYAKSLAIVAASLVVVGCGASIEKRSTVFLMPAPDIYEDGDIDPWIDNDPISRGVPPGILYATDREPAEPDDKKYLNYTHQRGMVLRLGKADIILGHNPDITWEEARRISLLKNRSDDFPLQVGDVEEFGILAKTIRPFDRDFERSDEPERRFIQEINDRLAVSKRKDVYIYVHGYKVDFENPLLVASELWHFLGYNGAFVAYSWPTKYSVFSYLSDLDSAVNSARNLRALIVEIARDTDVERIHVIGYSAGTRLVGRMLADFGIYATDLTDEEIRQLKLENVILIGSDVDRSIFGGYLIDGALRVPRALSIYQSANDGALAWSNRIFKRARLGQAFDTADATPEQLQWFADHPQLRMIDVTQADGGQVQGGHGYFRKSPWVSSDILMTLMYNLTPEERGLVTREGIPEWTFPPDYVERLRTSLIENAPELEPLGTIEASADD